jgi:hypothetical protein
VCHVASSIVGITRLLIVGQRRHTQIFARARGRIHILHDRFVGQVAPGIVGVSVAPELPVTIGQFYGAVTSRIAGRDGGGSTRRTRMPDSWRYRGVGDTYDVAVIARA